MGADDTKSTDTTKTDDKDSTDKGTTTDKPDGTTTDADKQTDKVDDAAGLKKALQATRKERDALLKAQRDAELSKLPELERAQTEAVQLKAEVERLTTDNLRRQIAMELGLPWNLAKRIAGDDEHTMREDGAELLKHFKVDAKAVIPDDEKNKKPPNDGKAKGKAGSGIGMNTLLRAAAGRPH